MNACYFDINNFSEYLFWDMDKSIFDVEKNKYQLIYKVVEFGQIEDWHNLLKLYGKEEIKNVVVNLRQLDPVTLSFLAFYFNLNKEEFRCYSPKPSVHNFWASSNE